MEDEEDEEDGCKEEMEKVWEGREVEEGDDTTSQGTASPRDSPCPEQAKEQGEEGNGGEVEEEAEEEDVEEVEEEEGIEEGEEVEEGDEVEEGEEVDEEVAEDEDVSGVQESGTEESVTVDGDKPRAPPRAEERKKRKREDKHGRRSQKHPPPQPAVPSPRTTQAAISREKIKRLRMIVDKAAQRKKVFTIFGKYPSVRDALISRGWVQNFDLQKLTLPNARQTDNDVSLLARLKCGHNVDDSDIHIISRLLRDTPVHFIWIMGDSIDWKSLSKTTIVSRFPRVYFTTKVGLCSYLEESHWFCEASVSNVNFPRCYTTDDLNAFIKDFRLTACLGLLRTLVTAVNHQKMDIFTGKIPLSAVKFAVKRCSEYVASQEHEDIDLETEEKVWDHQWDQFLTYYYQLVHEGGAFVTASDQQIQALYSCSKVALEGISVYWPQLEMDGINNLWLVKPGAKSRGRGISVCNKLEKIMAKLGNSNSPNMETNPPTSSSRFVIQKYVEKPLLIYNTKFDIRQWFLVTSAYPLTIWMYKESYLRFCSQLFSLSNLHESVHLTNNAVQCRYKNQTKRNKLLPDENMWDSYTFQAYLRSRGLSEHWESVVYKGMRESVTGALLAAQDHMEQRANCFELYGADFILTEDLKPWLIEINSSPAMSPTTSVTARMCPQCLEDVIKVVIDRRSNREADTGMFELIYRQNVSAPQPYMGMNLTVKGNKMTPQFRGKPGAHMASDGLSLASRGHSPSIQTALDILSAQLINEGELIINSSNSEIKKESEMDSTDNEQVCDKLKRESINKERKKQRQERRRREYSSYKKHSCVTSAPPSTFSNSLNKMKYNQRYCKKQARIHSVNISVRRLSMAPVSELLDWRRRVERTRADCNHMVSKLAAREESKSPRSPRWRRMFENRELSDVEPQPDTIECSYRVTVYKQAKEGDDILNGERQLELVPKSPRNEPSKTPRLEIQSSPKQEEKPTKPDLLLPGIPQKNQSIADFNNNFINTKSNSKYNLKSSSMINLPAVLKTK